MSNAGGERGSNEAVRSEQRTVITKDDAHQIVTGPALVPDRPDREGDVVSKENIEEVAYDYMKNHQKVDEMHDGNDRWEHDVVESYIAPQEFELGGTTIPKGTWMVSVQLGDDAWQKVQKGTFSGFSVEGKGVRT
jgi:hypothetical protein